MKIGKIIPLFILLLGFFFFFVDPFSVVFPGEIATEKPLAARVVRVLETVNKDDLYRQKLELLITGEKTFFSSSSVFKPKSIVIFNDESLSVSRRVFEAGDKVLLAQNKDNQTYYILDYDRSGPLFLLALIFLLAVIVVAGLQGLAALFGMLFSFIVIFKLILPLIIGGFSPLIAAVLGALIIIPATFYLSHGVNRKTTVAMIATFFTLLLSGLLAKIFASAANLTGLASEESSYLKIAATDTIDFRGLVLAGLIIGIMGILDDITVAQASIVNQLKQAKPHIGFRELYSRSMKVGRDHIGSLVNTLILVYTGASLPLLLLFLNHSQNFAQIISLEFMAEEIIRTLVGSLGLVLAVPITTFLAVLFLGGERENTKICCQQESLVDKFQN